MLRGEHQLPRRQEKAIIRMPDGLFRDVNLLTKRERTDRPTVLDIKDLRPGDVLTVRYISDEDFGPGDYAGYAFVVGAVEPTSYRNKFIARGNLTGYELPEVVCGIDMTMKGGPRR